MSDEKKITVTFPNGQTASRVVDLIVHNKPIGWSRKSYASYYTEDYGKMVQRIADKMIESKHPMVIRLDTQSCTMNTLYLRVNQGFRYLADNMDSDGKYKKFLCSVRISRKSGEGLSIEFKDSAEDLIAEDFVSEKDMPKWKAQLDEYLESDNPEAEPFHKTGLLLNPEDIRQLKLELGELKNIIFSVDSREVKVIKT
jgi:hypothetical protein